jgi:hypothetical protein
MGLKQDAVGNTLGTYGTYWEPDRNPLGQRKNEKNPPTPHPKLNRKKSRHFEFMLTLLPIGCMKFLCSKTVSSPFLAWANNTPPPHYKLGVLYLFIHLQV